MLMWAVLAGSRRGNQAATLAYFAAILALVAFGYDTAAEAVACVMAADYLIGSVAIVVRICRLVRRYRQDEAYADKRREARRG